jgi:peroxiredoxin
VPDRSRSSCLLAARCDLGMAEGRGSGTLDACRQAFIVGADGMVVDVIEKACPKTRAQDVLRLLERLDAAA